jgi:tripartite-type tricarboxylate transporter receptor subunit TctC
MWAFVTSALLAISFGAGSASAQDYPQKQPIKFVVPATPGGGTDVMARITAEFLQRRIGQSVIVENRPGASATIGAAYVAGAQPDGYTLLFCTSDFVAVPAVRANMPYKFDTFTYLVRGLVVHPLLFGSPKFSVSTIPELVNYMKANPGKVRYASTGVGGIIHLGMSGFQSGAGVKGVHVPYPGIAPAYTDMLAGNIEITEATPPFPAGIKVLGTVGSERNPSYPDLPTLEENGIKSGTWDLWYGLVAPPNLPKPIADWLITEVTAAMKDPEAIAKYDAAVKAKPDPNPLTGDAFQKAAVEDNKRWKAIADKEGIAIQ